MQVPYPVRAMARSLAAVAIASFGVLASPAFATASPGACRGPDRLPPDPGTVLNELYGIAMTSRCDLWVVGLYADGGRVIRRPLIEHWNGTRWAVQHSPVTTGVVTAVSAVSAGDAWVVGRSGHRALIEHWNGRTWRVVSAGYTRRGGVLTGVAATSRANAWAVGSYQIPPAGGLTRTLIVHWNGSTWRRVRSGTAGDLIYNNFNGVTAISAQDAWAVGEASGNFKSHALIAHWNGRSWRRVSDPAVNADGLSAVGSSSPHNVWAAGTGPGGTFIAHWNGSTWQRTPSPSPGFEGHVELDGIAAGSPSRAWAVGWFLTSQGNQCTLAEQWNGTIWQRVPSPNPGGCGYDVFNAVAAARSSAWAAGIYLAGPHAPLSSTLIAHIR